MIRRLLTNKKNCEEVAVIDGSNEITYRQLYEKSLALRTLLPDTHENVGILLSNSADYLSAFWGIIGAGLTAMPINVLMTEHEIIPLLISADVTIVVTSVSFRHIFQGNHYEGGNRFRIILIEELIAANPVNDCHLKETSPDEPMALLSTSGTTGKYKIVTLSERNVETSVLGYLDKLNLEQTDARDIKFVLAAPFSSVYGLLILSACLKKSFPVVVLNQSFTLDTLFKACETHKVTHYEGSASAIILMEKMIGREIPYDISDLNYFGTGGSTVSGDTIKRLQQAYKGKHFFHGYGMTEAAPLITKHPRAEVIKTGSAGTAINGVEIAVAIDDDIVHTPNTIGEIVARGPSIMLGYYKNDAETNKTIKKGYLYTGDIGYLDEEGYLYVCGRKKSMIIVRGFKVFPEEVEQCILNSRLAKDCVVYGQTDSFGNEIVCADIVPVNCYAAIDEIRVYCTHHLAHYKQPKIISFCNSINKNITGKTERRKEGGK